MILAGDGLGDVAIVEAANATDASGAGGAARVDHEGSGELSSHSALPPQHANSSFPSTPSTPCLAEVREAMHSAAALNTIHPLGLMGGQDDVGGQHGLNGSINTTQPSVQLVADLIDSATIRTANGSLSIAMNRSWPCGVPTALLATAASSARVPMVRSPSRTRLEPAKSECKALGLSARRPLRCGLRLGRL